MHQFFKKEETTFLMMWCTAISYVRLVYGYRKVDKGWKFQPSKVYINLLVIIFQPSHLVIINYKMLWHF
jgi:hypothetical protein